MRGKKTIVTNNDRQIADLILQLGRAAYADCAGGGLTQAQWMALRFFGRANRFSRNVSGFAEFHATTRGTASQTVKSLVERGCLSRTRSDEDGRRVRFDLTVRGREMLSRDPLEHLVRAAGGLGRARQAEISGALRELMAALAKNRSKSLAGVCAMCGHLDAGVAGSFKCRLMQERLERPELQELCVRFQPDA